MLGVFDSGLGGLTVLKEFIRLLPQYDYLYFGDNARAPYGDKDQETIYRYTKEAVGYLFDHGCSLVILACNTASADSLRKLQADYPQRKILGVLIPLAEAAVATSAQRIGVIATISTVHSNSYRREIQKLAPKTDVIQLATPLLVPLIENGLERSVSACRIIKKYILKLKSYNIQTVILGCTHYSFVAKTIKRYLGTNIVCLDSGAIVATKLQNYLQRHPEIESKLNQNKTVKILTTGEADSFNRSAMKYFGAHISAEKVSLK
jgi:glutamate racemase